MIDIDEIMNTMNPEPFGENGELILTENGNNITIQSFNHVYAQKMVDIIQKKLYIEEYEVIYDGNVRDNDMSNFPEGCEIILEWNEDINNDLANLDEDFFVELINEAAEHNFGIQHL